MLSRLISGLFRRARVDSAAVLMLREIEAVRRAVRLSHERRPALGSIIEQLEYFTAYLRGQNDGVLLANFNMGLIAAREVETGDPELAERIYRIESEAHKAARAV